MSHNTNKRIAQNTLFLYFRTLVILLVSLYTSRVVLNVLGIDDYGIYNVVGGIVLMFQFLNVGMIDVSQRFLTYELGKNDGQQLQKVFSTSLIIHLIIIFFLLILAETVGLWFLNHKMNIPTSRIIAANWVFQFSILTFIIKIFSVPYNASIVAHEHMKVYAYVSILEVILQLAIVFLLKGSASDKLILYAILMSFVTLLISIMYTLYCKKYFKECKFRNDIDKQLLHKMLSFAGWSFLGNIGYSLKMQGINILINLFFGPAVNAARGVAYQVNAGIYNFVSNFQIAMKPQITKRYAMGDTNSMMVLVHNSSRYSFFLTVFNITCTYQNSLYIKSLARYCTRIYCHVFTIGIDCNFNKQYNWTCSHCYTSKRKNKTISNHNFSDYIAGYTNILYCIKIRISTLYSHVYIYPDRTHCFNSTNMDT